MRSRLPLCALLLAALSSSVLAQAKAEPAIDVKKTRATADSAFNRKDYAASAASYKLLTEADSKDAGAWLRLGYSLHALGKLDEALPAHEKAAGFKGTGAIGAYNAACVHAMKGKADDAFAWLDKAIAAGFDDIETLQEDTDLAKIRGDARFAKYEEIIKAKAANPRVVAYAMKSERSNTRIAWFSKQGSPAQVAIDYTPVAWKAEYDGDVSSEKWKGRKWRFGGDFWTTLDTSVDLQVGGVAVPAGYYYLTLEQRDAKTFVLGLHDAAATKKLKLDAYQAERLKGGIEVPLEYATGEKVVEKLDLVLGMNEGSLTDGVFKLAFGGHRLMAPLVAKIE